MLVEPIELPIDPAAAQRGLDRFCLADRPLRCAGFGELEPKALRVRRRIGHMGFDILHGCKSQDGFFSVFHPGVSAKSCSTSHDSTPHDLNNVIDLLIRKCEIVG